MILVWFIVVLLAAGILAAIAAHWSPPAARLIALLAACLDFALGLAVWVRHWRGLSLTGQRAWIEQIDVRWIEHLGIRFHLAMDGLSLLLVMLTFFLGIVSVLASWKEIRHGIGFFHFNLMWILAGVVAVFLALDLFLFYFA